VNKLSSLCGSVWSLGLSCYSLLSARGCKWTSRKWEYYQPSYTWPSGQCCDNRPQDCTDTYP